MARVEPTPEHEFGFELRVCRWAERFWPPTGSEDRPVIVARQLGTDRRRWDTVVIEVDPAGLEQRSAFGPEELDSDLLHVVRNAPEEWSWYRDALPDPGYPWRYVREAVHDAAERGAVETRRDGNRIQLRRIAPYPDWIRRVIAIENKPDLEASAARDLAPQLERDIALGLADEVWVATRSTDRRTEPVLLEAMPDAAGVLSFRFGDPDPTDVLWHPRRLRVDAVGTRIVDRSQWGVRFEFMDAGDKADKRYVLGERAYGRGWRNYHATMRPDCAGYDLHRAGIDDTDLGGPRAYVPYCHEKGRQQTAAECSGSCPAFAPEPPGWRQLGWPLTGGPGAGLRRLLDRRHRRWRSPDDD